jgi:ATP-dependent DNA helicase PIF1
MIKFPDKMVIADDNETTSIRKLIDIVFPELNTYQDNSETMINRIILSPKNENVDFINAMLIEQFPGDSIKYYSFDEAINPHAQSFDEDFFNTLTPNGVPPHELILKTNCPIILLRNINLSEGLCNGTRLLCKRFDRNIIDAEIAVGQYKNKRVFFYPVYHLCLLKMIRVQFGSKELNSQFVYALP